ncbi:transmembrane protein 160 isoform X2 [Dermochelys coriacea]|uniref:transmembrane protein 160 isoform X2 n=1 Tax=Dermochelys coriacea TaxID=27794 RepID=UPI001CA9D2B0|nr:transmembrane protein 160 isoform X2 [Dermochelys coriacea]
MQFSPRSAGGADSSHVRVGLRIPRRTGWATYPIGLPSEGGAVITSGRLADLSPWAPAPLRAVLLFPVLVSQWLVGNGHWSNFLCPERHGTRGSLWFLHSRRDLRLLWQRLLPCQSLPPPPHHDACFLHGPAERHGGHNGGAVLAVCRLPLHRSP